MAPKRKAAAKSAAPAEDVEVHNEEEETTVATPEIAAEATAPSATPEEVPAAEEAPAEPEVPYTPIPIGGSTTEIYSQLQTTLAADSAKVNYYLPQLLELVQAAESVDTPILMRVRFVEFVGHHVAAVRDNNALRKVVTALVKIVSGEDNTPQLLTAAVQAFAGLGPVSVVDKSWEYLAREGADVLMQVMIDRDAFPETVRHAAAKSLDSLTNSAFRPVLAKLVHWLSVDREDDDEEQIVKERHMALTRLSHLVMPGSARRKHLNEETEKFAAELLQRVLGTVNVREFVQLARICASLPDNKAKGNVPLLDWYLSTHKLNDERNVESAAIIARYVSGTVEYDLTPALEAAGILGANLNAAEDSSVNVAKVVLLASRVATPEAADKLYPYVFAQAEAMLVDMCPTLTSSNLHTVEAVLFAAVAIARKKSAEVLQKLNDDVFNASAVAAAQAAAAVHKEVVFAVKKAAANKEATREDADAAASLANIQTILEAFAAKRLPLGELHESWTHGQNPMPTAKRARDGLRTAMPPPPGSQAAVASAQKRGRSQHEPDHKRQRNDQNDRHRGGNNNNNCGHSNNNNNNRSQSRSNRGPRRNNRH